MTAAEWNPTIERGATWRKTITVQDANGAAVSITDMRMTIRQSVDHDAAALELTTNNGRVAIDGAAGSGTLVISDTDTAALSIDYGVYDVEIVETNGSVQRILEGSVTISPEVTR